MSWADVLTRREWRRLTGFGAAVVLLHVLGWGLFAYAARGYPAFVGLGTVAYTLGLRHAVDADHIAAIDNTARKLLQDGQRPLGVGFFFAIGHAAVVCVLALTVALAAARVGSDGSRWAAYGDVASAVVSGSFLLLIGLLNVVVLRDTVKVFRRVRGGRDPAIELETLLAKSSPRSFGGLARRISASWQMLPLGIAFGLGFGTATEVALLTLAAGAGTSSAPLLAVLSLPLLFAAGMTLLDTADGAFMTHAYSWAFSNPLRKLSYNLTVTGVSVAAALGIGAARLLEAASVPSFDFAGLGYVLVGGLVFAWAVSAAVWKVGRA